MFKGLRDYVVVDPDTDLTDSTKYDYTDDEGNTLVHEIERGTVVACGPGVHNCGAFDPINNIHVGDQVFFVPRSCKFVSIPRESVCLSPRI